VPAPPLHAYRYELGDQKQERDRPGTHAAHQSGARLSAHAADDITRCL